jgi:serine/threonine protein kinase
MKQSAKINSSYAISFVGEGESGCVVTPHIHCSIVTPKTVKTVGKIFSNKDEFQEETENIKFIKRVDHNDKWTVKYYGSCEIPKHQILDAIKNVYTPDNDVQHVCFQKVNFRSTATHFRQIIYEYGGISLSQAIATYPMNMLVNAFYRLFEGIFILALNGTFINDIKADNIAYHRVKNKLKFIDFGAAKYIDPSDDRNTYYASTILRNLSSFYDTCMFCLKSADVKEEKVLVDFGKFLAQLKKIITHKHGSFSNLNYEQILEDVEVLVAYVAPRKISNASSSS